MKMLSMEELSEITGGIGTHIHEFHPVQSWGKGTFKKTACACGAEKYYFWGAEVSLQQFEMQFRRMKEKEPKLTIPD